VTEKEKKVFLFKSHVVIVAGPSPGFTLANQSQILIVLVLLRACGELEPRFRFLLQEYSNLS